MMRTSSPAYSDRPETWPFGLTRLVPRILPSAPMSIFMGPGRGPLWPHVPTGGDGYQALRCDPEAPAPRRERSEEHTSELQSPCNLVCRLLLEKKKIII